MLERLARILASHAKWIALAAVVSGLVAAVYGSGVARVLAPGGFEVAGGEAVRVARSLEQRFGHGDPDIVALVGREGELVDEPAARERVNGLAQRLRERPEVALVRTPLDPGGDALVSNDRATALIAVALHGDARAKESAFPALVATLHDGAEEVGVDVAIGGEVAVNATGQDIAERDLLRAEMVAFPLVAVLLLVFFRGRVAAVLPLAVGGLSIAFATALLRALTHVTSISVFALNVVTLLGFGLAIDYSLFVVQRFREELASAAVGPAVVRTLASAGKTMLYSGIAVAVSLLGLLAFPIMLLHSIAIAGALIVALSVLAALVVLPATLVLLGHRIDWPRRAESADAPVGGTVWARIANRVMRRPGLTAAVTAALLLVMGAPMLGIRTALSDARIFPPDSEVRQVQRVLDAPDGFAQGGTVRYTMILDADAPVLSQPVLEDLIATHDALVADPDVVHVEDLVSAVGHAPRDALRMMASTIGLAEPPGGLDELVDGDATVMTVVARAPPDRNARRAQLSRLRGLASEHFGVAVGGRPVVEVEVDEQLRRGLAPALGVIVVVTLVVLTLAFGAVVVAVKAVVMNALSLCATIGALVWVFQRGHLEGLLHYESTGTIDPLVLLVMFAIVFGLSMDYELFLLSRIREEFDEIGDADIAVLHGLSATGRLITMAGLMLIVVLLGFGAAQILFVKQLGLGMALAVAVDATVVRAVLVPATMHLLGRWAWWSPSWFERWWVKSGIGVREAPPGVEPPPHRMVHAAQR